MPLQHVVKRGDSLWGLAGRHLGNFARWPELLEYHNSEVLKSGGNRGRVFSIKDPNVIFVGQILYLPIRDKHMMRTAKGSGTKVEAGNTAVPIDLKVEYAIGQSGKPLVFTYQSADQVITVEIRGKIDIKITSPDRFRHNLELIISKDERQCRQRLMEIYDPAILLLTAKPKIKLTKSTLVIDSPLASNVGSGLCMVKLNSEAEPGLSASLKPRPVTGIAEIGGRKYQFDSEIEWRVAVANNGSITHDPYKTDYNALLRDASYGFRAAGVVIREAFKIVAVDVAFALLNYIPLPKGISFIGGRILSGGVIIKNYRGLEHTASQIEQELDGIRMEVYRK